MQHSDDYDAHQLIASRVKLHSEALMRPIDYIEVGVLMGHSAIAVLSTFKVRIAVLVDDFSNTHCGDARSSQALLERNLEDYKGLYQIIAGDSKTVLPTIDVQFDVGFVDGDHSAEGCLSDMTNMLPLLKDNGIMFVHDLTNPGHLYLKQVVEKFAEGNNLEMKYHPNVHNALGELTRKHSNGLIQ